MLCVHTAAFRSPNVHSSIAQNQKAKIDQRRKKGREKKTQTQIDERTNFKFGLESHVIACERVDAENNFLFLHSLVVVDVVAVSLFPLRPFSLLSVTIVVPSCTWTDHTECMNSYACHSEIIIFVFFSFFFFAELQLVVPFFQCVVCRVIQTIFPPFLCLIVGHVFGRRKSTNAQIPAQLLPFEFNIPYFFLFLSLLAPRLSWFRHCGWMVRIFSATIEILKIRKWLYYLHMYTRSHLCQTITTQQIYSFHLAFNNKSQVNVWYELERSNLPYNANEDIASRWRRGGKGKGGGKKGRGGGVWEGGRRMTHT